MPMYSPVATKVQGTRDPALGIVRRPWGFLVHTTGGGITPKAKREGKTPLETAIATYIASQNGSNGYKWGGPGYVCDYDGKLYQLAPDEVETMHAGDHSEQYPHGTRLLYHDGSWETHCSHETVAQWRLKWPAFKHPYSLFPSASPNLDYVGLEMIPIGDGYGGEPMAAGLRFTKAQHDAVASLAKDLAQRHGFPAGWQRTGRFVGHEDVDPIQRSDVHGGWDPGWLRVSPYFDFEYVRAQL